MVGLGGYAKCTMEQHINILVAREKSRDVPARIVATLRRMNIAVKAQE